MTGRRAADRRGPAGLGCAVLALALGASPAGADPKGAVEIGSELLVSGGAPRSRAGLAVTAYVRRRLGLRAAAHLVTLDPFADQGVATAGVAYRAAAARPRLELVVRAQAGVAWQPSTLAPAFELGTTTFLWPTRAPIALTLDLGAITILDGVVDTRTAISLGLGLAVAR